MSNAFSIAVVRNPLKASVDDDLEKLIAYEKQTLGIDIKIKTYDTNLPVSWESFGLYTIENNATQELFGLNDIQEHLRPYIPAGVFHAVVFLYDYDQTIFSARHPGGMIAHWTRWSELHPGTEMIEIATTPYWDKKNDIFRVLTHELRHAYVFRLRRRGIPIPDYMDNTPVLRAGKLEWIPYYKEFDVYAEDGNRAKQNALFQGRQNDICIHPQRQTLLDKLFALIAQKRKKGVEERLRQFCLAIQQHEGWFSGSCSYRGNNPGNLRWSATQIGVHTCGSGEFSMFKTYEDGFNALMHQVRIVANGTSKVYNERARALNLKDSSLLTISQFFAIYAPSSDNNNPQRYAEFVAQKVGLPTHAAMMDLLA